MSDRWQQRNGRGDDQARRGSIAVGLFLVLLGIFFLAAEQLRLDVGPNAWPIFVIAPGVFLLLVGLAIPNEGGLGAAIPGGIITTVGILLAIQAATDTYASWAYAWALVAPGSVGATLALYGLLHRRWDLLDAGLRTAAVGLGLFVGFGLFFENLIGIDEGSRGTALRDVLPLMAVGLGVVIVIVNLIPRRPTETGAAPETPNWTSPPTPPPAG
jgi:hypothetical protein